MAIQHLSYQQTGYFSKLVTDYLNQSSNLEGLYRYVGSFDGIKEAINDRKNYKTDRVLLRNQLQQQYDGVVLTPKQKHNLDSLLNEHVFTVTTAHQPNIFTGPLYYIYKIVYAIKMADELNIRFPENHIVPIFYIGSEDADLDELNHIFLKEEKIVWNTNQTGAVGRMQVDDSLIKLIDNIYGQLGVYPYGKEIKERFQKAYQKCSTIAEATFTLLNDLFKDSGLLIINPDNTAFKRSFIPVIEKEIKEQFSLAALQPAKQQLEKHYKVQAAGRAINLFYLTDNKRERIEIGSQADGQTVYKIHNSTLTFTLEELLKEVNNYPERFSPNVILRGLLQETILPNLAYIGGGGELAYWLELKEVFSQAKVFYPMLLLRNSFLIYNVHQQELMNKLGLQVIDLFSSAETLLNNYVNTHSKTDLTLNKELQDLETLYRSIYQKIKDQDRTLAVHLEALLAKHKNKLVDLEKKIFKSQKRKFSDTAQQINKLKQQLFPNNELQERVYNFSTCYSKFGEAFLTTIYNATEVFGKEFLIVQG